MIEQIEAASKVFYLGTILLSARLGWLAWRGRGLDKFIRNIFAVYLVLLPLYAVFAVMYVFDIYYAAAAGYIGWTVINTLFLATDTMLLEYIISKAGRKRLGGAL